MLDKFPDYSIVYVDVDAEFCKYPELFDQLHARSDVNIAVHLLDHMKRGRTNAGFEMLSGTIFFKNNLTTRDIVDEWKNGCAQGGKLWDQSALAKVLEDKPYYVLPEEYCKIFDYMGDVKDPVIQHYQASRQVSQKSQYLKKDTNISEVTEEREYKEDNKEVQRIITPKPPILRKVTKGNLVRFRRKYRGS
jgi:hypothetical protein